MRTFTAFVFMTAFALITIAEASTAQFASNNYEKRSAEINAAYNSAIAEALANYQAEIATARQIYQSEGNLDGVLAAMEEAKRVSTDANTTKDDTAELPPILARARSSYRRACDAAAEYQFRSLSSLTQMYANQLHAQEKIYLSKQNLDAVRAVRDEILRLNIILSDIQTRYQKGEVSVVMNNNAELQTHADQLNKIQAVQSFEKQLAGKWNGKSTSGWKGEFTFDEDGTWRGSKNGVQTVVGKWKKVGNTLLVTSQHDRTDEYELPIQNDRLIGKSSAGNTLIITKVQNDGGDKNEGASQQVLDSATAERQNVANADQYTLLADHLARLEFDDAAALANAQLGKPFTKADVDLVNQMLEARKTFFASYVSQNGQRVSLELIEGRVSAFIRGVTPDALSVSIADLEGRNQQLILNMARFGPPEIYRRLGRSETKGTKMLRAMMVYQGPMKMEAAAEMKSLAPQLSEKIEAALNKRMNAAKAIHDAGLKKDAASQMMDDTLNKIDIRSRLALGDVIKPLDQTLFGGEMTIRAYQRGIILVHSNEKPETIVLAEKNPKQPALGDISVFYREQGGTKQFGEPREGEHSVFGDKYRLHVFSNAVIIWRKKGRVTHAVTFEQNFK